MLNAYTGGKQFVQDWCKWEILSRIILSIFISMWRSYFKHSHLSITRNWSFKSSSKIEIKCSTCFNYYWSKLTLITSLWSNEYKQQFPGGNWEKFTDQLIMYWEWPQCLSSLLKPPPISTSVSRYRFWYRKERSWQPLSSANCARLIFTRKKQDCNYLSFTINISSLIIFNCHAREVNAWDAAWWPR